jgi:hypothetical protein
LVDVPTSTGTNIIVVPVAIGTNLVDVPTLTGTNIIVVPVAIGTNLVDVAATTGTNRADVPTTTGINLVDVPTTTGTYFVNLKKTVVPGIYIFQKFTVQYLTLKGNYDINGQYITYTLRFLQRL